MKEVIEKLKKVGSENWGFCEIQSHEARIIADALEVATFPPMVRAVLATMEFLPENEIDFFWVSVNATGTVRTHEQKPAFAAGGWRPESGVSCIQFELPVLGLNNETAEKLLFHRTPNGWEWYGNPNKQKEQI